MRKIALVIFSLIMSLLCSCKESLLSVEEDFITRDEFIKRYNENVELKITTKGQISIGNFEYSLIDSSQIDFFEAGKYITMINDRFFAVDMMIDTAEGVRRYGLFANYENNEIIFNYNIASSPGSLVYIMHNEKHIIFVYSGYIECHNAVSGKSLWSYRWKEKNDYNWEKTINSYSIDENIITLVLENGNKLKFKTSKGYFK